MSRCGQEVPDSHWHPSRCPLISRHSIRLSRRRSTRHSSRPCLLSNSSRRLLLTSNPLVSGLLNNCSVEFDPAGCSVKVLPSRKEIVSTLAQFIAHANTQFGARVKAVLCDNGREFDNSSTRHFFLTQGIHLRMSCPYTSPQNGTSPSTPDAACAPAGPHEAVPGAPLESPEDTEDPPTPALYVPLCCGRTSIAPRVAPELPDASSPSAPPASSPALVPVPRGPPPGFPPLRPARDFTYVYTRRPREPPAAPAAASTAAPAAPGAPSVAAAPAAPLSTAAPAALLPKGAVPVPPVANQHPMSTRSKSGYKMPALYHAVPLSPVPNTFRSALADPNWRAAMEEEHGALLQNHTWDLVPRPPRANIVTGKWIFKHKLQSDGSFERYKAHWVLRGFTQRPGVDFDETFSPVRALRVSGHRSKRPLLRGSARSAHALPHRAAPAALKGHREPLKVPSEGAQRPEEVDAEDDVETAQAEPDAGDVEGRAVDEDWHVTSDPLAREALAASDRNAKLLAPLWSEAQATHGGPLEKRVSSRARKHSPLIATGRSRVCCSIVLGGDVPAFRLARDVETVAAVLLRPGQLEPRPLQPVLERHLRGGGAGRGGWRAPRCCCVWNCAAVAVARLSNAQARNMAD
uniref:Reverse transcriptase Ty1/copia-type domain-containing protein n=1 Tax=Sorghum bicolor TaxID=4558 RepID=C6JRK6_SORBI